MKNSKVTKVIAFALLIAMITLISLSGTYAKYTSSKSVTGTAVVAKWDIKIDGTDITNTTSTTFDLFDTIKELNVSSNSILSTDDETDVAEDLIAPGTGGTFSFDITNDSEVTAKYGIEYTIENPLNVPLEFSTDQTTWYTNISDVNVDIEDAGSVLAFGATGNQATATVHWRWVYEKGADASAIALNDSGDTDIGLAAANAANDAAKSVVVTAKFTATQVD